MTDFDRLLPPLATLVAFEAAFRHQNFTRAAEELYNGGSPHAPEFLALLKNTLALE